MNLLITHDISKVKHTKFIEYTIWHVLGVPNQQNNIYLYIHSLNNVVDENVRNNIISNIYTEIKKICGYSLDPTCRSLTGWLPGKNSISVLENSDEVQNIIQDITATSSLITMESDTLLPKPILYSLVELKSDHNILLPLLIYKYSHKEVFWKGKKYRVKNFINSEDLFYPQVTPHSQTKFIPDWDERYHMTHGLLAKLDDNLPFLSPSPLLHEYRTFRCTIINSIGDGKLNQDDGIRLNNMSLAVHKFEDTGISLKCSLERQDEFVYHVLAKHLKSPGTFLDVGCATPVSANNTYILEKYLNWTGLAFDIGDVEADENWSKYRNTTFKQIDATSPEMTSYLQNLDNKVFDYISLDVDSYDTSYSAEALKRIMDAGIEFKVMTLEHESFKHGTSITKPTRDILHSKGYRMLFEDVSFEDENPWEDWWINPELIPIENIMNIYKKGATFNECINTLISFTE